MAATQDHPPSLQQRLLQVSAACSFRGLVKSAQWAADLANAMELEQPDHFSHPDDSTSSLESEAKAEGLMKNFHLSFHGHVTPNELAVTFLAKTYFDTREFQRCSHVLKDCTSPLPSFLRCYSSYLAGERGKEEAHPDIFGSGTAINTALEDLRSELERRHRKTPLDAYLMYMLALVYKEQGLRQKAWAHFIQAVAMEPLLWAAWDGLISLCHETSHVDKVLVDENIASLEGVFVVELFKAHVFVELQATKQAMAIYNSLLELFPSSTNLIGRLAVAHYHAREGDQAETLFAQMRGIDPYRLDNLDIYSNILYVENKSADLCHLAQEAHVIDRYRPETCVVLGNYYSMKSQHARAVESLQRALKLNRRYLSAWTLIGHEYIELKNTSAAVAAYRQAIEINARDYRAWYGLGNTYEMLGMPAYAANYFSHAKRLRPSDPRMWSALGAVYERMGRYTQAVQALRMCASLDEDVNPKLVHRMALIYKDKMHPPQLHEAAKLFELMLEETEEGVLVDSEEALEACDYLSSYYSTVNKDDVLATKYANVLMSYGGPHKERAKSVLQRVQGGGVPGRARGTTMSSPLARTSEGVAASTMAEEPAPPQFDVDSSMDMSDFS
eukprot:TRINITY_DN10070_c0_g1_i2.p1 TRINITY_DN10070_c0_g1~~TRINITY_DN10070_c0_g1_i2.p1  ORF type:complete len:635 (+),score=127.88 TRINITY_DN10070_c0_g1_i2:64-1905(+)